MKNQGKLEITSLNSHFAELYSGTKCREHKKAEPVTPHLLSLNQDIVAWSQGGKCGLKYVIHISGGPGWTSVEHTYNDQWNYAGMISIS
jgi:hypothetical protein